jgi:hypothetical protein
VQTDIATLLVSPRPLSQSDIERLQTVAREQYFEILLSPTQSTEPVLNGLASSAAETVVTAYPLNISAPTDNSPFFFQLLRLDKFRSYLNTNKYAEDVSISSVYVLVSLGVIVLVILILFIIVPLMLHGNNSLRLIRTSISSLSLFVFIGFGFMFIELSQLQRLIIFLGHPIFGLLVVLFSLLVFAGIGSWVTQHFLLRRLVALRMLPIIVVAGLAVYSIGSGPLLEAFRAAGTFVRISLATAMLAPLGLILGTLFPSGLTLALRRDPSLGPWLWGINGAASVAGSVAGMWLALAFGISQTMWVGVAMYALASCLLALQIPRPIKEEIRR